MAKTAMIERNLKIAKTIDKYAAKRAELKERIRKGDKEAIRDYHIIKTKNCIRGKKLKEKYLGG